jgi:hypothetical protein
VPGTAKVIVAPASKLVTDKVPGLDVDVVLAVVVAVVICPAKRWLVITLKELHPIEVFGAV